MGSRLGHEHQKACLVVLPLFRADSGTNLIKQGGIFKGRSYGSVDQLAECLHGKRDALRSCPDWDNIVIIMAVGLFEIKYALRQTFCMVRFLLWYLKRFVVYVAEES